MPRKPRTYIPDFPYHVIQRGNNRSDCFFEDSDYEAFLGYLGEACKRYGVALHAYVLMTNHSHLLMTPANSEGIAKVMQSLGRCYVQYINKKQKRSGTLWEGRHRSSLVDSDAYLLSCYRYIESNPVRANMVEDPGDYYWSSFRTNAYGLENQNITPHQLYLALGKKGEGPARAYRQFFDMEQDMKIVNEIRIAGQFSTPLGNSEFINQVERILGRKTGYAKRGRPALKIVEALR